MQEIQEIAIVVTKTGRPAVWEFGGGHRRIGNAQIVCDALGEPKKALYERRRGPLALGEHALLPLAKGDHIVRATRGWRDEVVILRVTGIDTSRATAQVEEVATWADGEWSKPLPGFLEAAVTAAVEKSQCYHCRGAHFIQR